MHFSTLAVAAALASSVAAINTYTMSIGILIGGDVMSTRPAKVGSIGARDSALVITRKPMSEKTKPDLFQLDNASGQLKYVSGSPVAATLVSGPTHKNVFTFSAGAPRTLNGQSINTKNPGPFQIIDEGSSAWGFNLRLSGKAFAMCEFGEEGNTYSVLVARRTNAPLVMGCMHAFVGLTKVDPDSLRLDNDEVDLVDLDA